MVREKIGFWRSIVFVLLLVSVLWLVQFIQYFGIYDFSHYGNWPQHRAGLPGILFSPFIHGSFEHLISNTLPIIVLLLVLLNAYPRFALLVLVAVHLMSGALVWLLAPPTGIHIGISGIIYGIAGFLRAWHFSQRPYFGGHCAVCRAGLWGNDCRVLSHTGYFVGVAFVWRTQWRAHGLFAAQKRFAAAYRK
ncbi:MAG: rhomboid family intramembrane serine protease [Bacteroidetes bacterium]|nr:rhomboid family intramembrane serine protease [Bacteroidota bacterium]